MGELLEIVSMCDATGLVPFGLALFGLLFFKSCPCVTRISGLNLRQGLPMSSVLMVFKLA